MPKNIILVHEGDIERVIVTYNDNDYEIPYLKLTLAKDLAEGTAIIIGYQTENFNNPLYIPNRNGFRFIDTIPINELEFNIDSLEFTLANTTTYKIKLLDYGTARFYKWL